MSYQVDQENTLIADFALVMQFSIEDNLSVFYRESLYDKEVFK
jgi:hypothetical protein